MDFVYEHYKNSDLSLLNKLTLVIPTYNRNYYLSRCLWYHAHFPFGQIIIADSSPEEIKVVNREIVAKARERFEVNIRYQEYVPETEEYGGDIYRKWADAVLHVDTEYSQIVTDKDFILPKTIISLISFLDNNNNYIIADGVHYSIEIDNNNDYEYRLVQSIDNHEDNSWLRFLKMIDKPGCTLFALHRTTAIKQVYQSMIDDIIDDIRFGELYLELKDVITGNCMTNPDFVLICRDTIQFEKLHGSDKKMQSSSFRYPQIWEYNKELHKLQINKFRNGITNKLLNDNPAYSIEIRSQINNLLDLFIEKRLGKCNPLQRIRLLRKIFYYLPKNLRDSIRQHIIPNSCGISEFNTIKYIKSEELEIIKMTIEEYNTEKIIG